MKGKTMWLVICLMLAYVVSVDAFMITLDPEVDSLESIQQAIADADTVFAPIGTYPGNYVINFNDRVILGEDPESTIFVFDPDGLTSNVFTVLGEDITISGITITGGSSGIWTSGSVTINDVIFPNATAGVWIDGSGELNGGSGTRFTGCRFGIVNSGVLNFDGSDSGAYFYDNWRGIQNLAGGWLTVVHTIFDGDSISIKSNGVPGIGIFVWNCIFKNTKYNAMDFRQSADDTLGPGIPAIFSIVNNTAHNIANNFIWLEYVLDPDISNNIVHRFHCGVASNIPITIHSYNCFDFDGMYGDVYWNVEADDTIMIDPDFGDPDKFILLDTSPCIDAGDPDSSWNDPDDTRNDMGCYGGPLGWWNGFTGDYIPAMVVDPGVPPEEETEVFAYPNPFNKVVCFSMPEPGTITIFDMSGKVVWVSEKATAVFWDGTDDTGGPLATSVYFYKTSLGRLGRIVMVK